MKPESQRIYVPAEWAKVCFFILFGFVFLASAGLTALGSDAIQTSGDIIQIVLPVTAAGMTLYNHDSDGAFQFAKSAALTVGITYALKYGVDEKRPNGGGQSFPSGHSSISFSSAEFMRKRYGWEY